MDSERLAEILNQIKFNVDVQVIAINQGERGVHCKVGGGITIENDVSFGTDADGAQELKDFLEPKFNEISAVFMMEMKEQAGQYPDDTWEIDELKAWLVHHTDWTKEKMDEAAGEEGRWVKSELLDQIPEQE